MNITPFSLVPKIKPSVPIIPPLVIDWNKPYLPEEATELSQKLILKYLSITPSRIDQGVKYFPFIKLLRVELIDHQVPAIQKALAKILRHHRGIQLLSATGTGKTYIYCGLLHILSEEGFFSAIPIRGIPIFEVLVITKANVIPQTKEVLQSFGFIGANAKLRVFVTNYDSLRASLGEMFIDWKSEVKNGELEINPVWKVNHAPIMIIWDENQALRNENSLQTRVARAWNNLHHTQRIFSLYSSATPGARVSEMRCVVVGCGVETDNGYGRYRVSEVQWPSFADSVCPSRFRPCDYSPAAMRALRESISDYIVHVNGVRFPYKSVNSHILIDFESPEQELAYIAAYDEYIEKLREILADPTYTQGGMARIFVAMMKFRQKAELLRAGILARMIKEFEKQGKNVILGLAFRETLESVKSHLIELGYTKEQISEIHGSQTREVREQNKQDFQNEKTHIMLLMIAAGGVGLSLHHNPSNKRPRQVVLTPVWNIIEMLQVLGRAHRINSQSPTHQSITWFRGTIEEHVMAKLKMKHKSLSQLLERKEQFHDMFTPPDVDFSGMKEQNVRPLENGQHDESEDEDTLDVEAEVTAENTEESEE